MGGLTFLRLGFFFSMGQTVYYDGGHGTLVFHVLQDLATQLRKCFRIIAPGLESYAEEGASLVFSPS